MFGVCDETVPIAPRWSAAGRGVALWFGGITGAYEVELNGAPVAGEGSFDPLTEVVGVSDIVVLPERLLRGDGTDALTVRFADSWFGRLSHSDWIIGDAFVIQNLQNQRAQSEGTWLVALVMLHGIFALFALVLAVFSRRLSTAMLVPMFGIFCFWKLYEHPLAADWGLLTSGVYRAYLLSIFPAVALAGAFTLSHSGAGGRSGLRALGAWALVTLLVCGFAFHGLSSAQVYTACELSSVAVLALVVGKLILERRRARDVWTIVFGLGVILLALVIDPQVLGGADGMSWQRYVVDGLSLLYLASFVALSARAYARDQQRLHAISEELLAASEMVRHDIAQELHDGIAQELTAMRLQLLAPCAETPSKIASDLQGTLHDVRALSHTLAEPVALSISNRIRRHVEAWACTASAEVDFVCTGDVGLMTDEEAHHVLRLIQEALGNALKHADPERVCISLSHDEGRVRVAVVDDGNGVGQKRGVGLGMRSMRRRAKLLGSRLEIETGTAGTGVSVVFAPSAAIKAT